MRAGRRRLPGPILRPTSRPRPGHRRRLLRVAAVVLLALVGAYLGVALAASETRAIGPVDVEFSASLRGQGPASVVHIAPLGAVEIDSHSGPLRLSARVVQLRDAESRQLLADPTAAQELRSQVEGQLRSALTGLAVRGLLGAAVGALLLGGLVFRRPALTLLTGAVGIGGTLASIGIAAATWQRDALAQPRYTGLLSAAPALVGSVDQLANRFGQYRNELAGLVDNVTRLYRTGASLPVAPVDSDTIRVLHVSDLHLNPAGFDLETTIAQQFDVDLVVDTGDITDWGTAPETRAFARLRELRRTLVYVRGNHDSREVQAAVDRLPDSTVLDGRAATVAGLRLLGAGDPRFTPDQETRQAPDVEEQRVRDGGDRLAALVDPAAPPDLVLVHDPTAAEPLVGRVPLVLAGHTHERDVSVRAGTVVLVQGSTGGAGLRGLQGEAPTPLTCSVLYLDRRTHRLVAYDDITLGGLGLASATVERHLPPDGAADTPSPAPATQTATAAPATTAAPAPATPTPTSASPSLAPAGG